MPEQLSRPRIRMHCLAKVSSICWIIRSHRPPQFENWGHVISGEIDHDKELIYNPLPSEGQKFVSGQSATKSGGQAIRDSPA